MGKGEAGFRMVGFHIRKTWKKERSTREDSKDVEGKEKAKFGPTMKAIIFVFATILIPFFYSMCI